MADQGKFGGPGFEAPQEMRDFALKSVEQARRAFDGFIGATKEARSVQDNAVEATGEAVRFAEQNMKAAFDHAQKLVQAKGIEEVVHLQSDFMRAQIEAMQSQLKAFTDGIQGKKS
ncbi:MAG: phasin family protein [Beijerinckiaceae bacterium]